MADNLRGLINIIDSLRDIGLDHYINLPRICVVGTQSSGKSSVLASIVGIDFLPRGDGIVTRRPIEFRLININQDDQKSWAVFDKFPDEILYDFDEVRARIDQLTNNDAGANKGIIKDPIVLTVYSPLCPDLTLVDLPGITRVPLKGSDQTDDIENVTRDMALHYAKDPKTIILAVIAANVDITTSDALQISRMVDPKGVRTIGVITKIDLMDKGTNALKMLRGDEIPLRLGYTGVKNRSHSDIMYGKTIQDCLKDEKDFFASHPIYKNQSSSLFGMQSLIEKLTKIFFHHIRLYLPEIKRDISLRIGNIQQRLTNLGFGVPEESQEQMQLMWTMITDYCDIFRNTIRGKFDKKLQSNFENQEVVSGAYIRSIFNQLLIEFIDTNVTESMSDFDIDSAIQMHEGDSLPGFPSPDSFEYLIIPHLKSIGPSVTTCLDRVSQALEDLFQTAATKVFSRFPKIIEKVIELSHIALEKEKENTRSILEKFVAAETGLVINLMQTYQTGYLFTNDAKYLAEHGSIKPVQEKKMNKANNNNMSNNASIQYSSEVQKNLPVKNQTPYAQAAYNSIQSTVSNIFSLGTDDSNKRTHYNVAFIEEIRSRLDAYFLIVLHNIRDSVPKIIGYFLVRQLQDKLQFELYSEFNKPDILSNFLCESPLIKDERLSLIKQHTVLKKALLILQKDTSMPIFASHEEDYSDFDQCKNDHTNRIKADSILSGGNPKDIKNKAYFPPNSSINNDELFDNKTSNLFKNRNTKIDNKSDIFATDKLSNPK